VFQGERGEQGERGADVKSTMFTTQAHETKGLVNEVNVVRKYFRSERTPRAKPTPLELEAHSSRFTRKTTPRLSASAVRFLFGSRLVTSDSATYSLLIPCFCAWSFRKPAIHAASRAREKKFPVIFPVIRNSEQYFFRCDKTFRQN